MSANFLDRLISAPPSALPSGWAAWLPHDALSMPTATERKARPWCRGRGRNGAVEWFPRTTKPPFEGTRYAVHSPAGHVAGLTKPGWFVVNAYVRRSEAFAPSGDALGVFPPALLEKLYQRLENLYWDSERPR